MARTGHLQATPRADESACSHEAGMFQKERKERKELREAVFFSLKLVALLRNKKSIR